MRTPSCAIRWSWSAPGRSGYVALVDARRRLSDAEAAALDSRLVLILANHIGDLEVLNEAIALAKAPANSPR